MAAAIEYFVVGLMVMAAVIFIGRRVWCLLHGKGSGCRGGCSSCSSTTVTIVPLESLSKISSDACRQRAAGEHVVGKGLDRPAVRPPLS
jgi:hypothetical protein